MSTVKRVRKNIFALSLSSLSKVLTVLLLIFCANTLKGENWGVLAAALALTEIFSVVADLGLSSLTIREVARDRNQAGRYLTNVGFIKLFLALITFALVYAFAHLEGKGEIELTVIYILAFRIIIYHSGKFLDSIFQAFEKMEYSALTSSVERLTSFSLGWLALHMGLGVLGVAWAILLGSVFYLLLTAVIVFKKFARPRFPLEIRSLKPLIKTALPFGLTFIFIAIYFRVDMVMLKAMKGAVVVGWYAASYQILQALMIVPGITMAVLFPLLSRYFRYSKESLILTYQKSFKYMLYLALPMAVGITLVADRVIFLLYPGLEGYTNSIVALKILIWASALIFVNTVMANVMNSINEVKRTSLFVGINAIVNIGLNFVFIPEWGLNLSYRGAAITTLICEGIGFCLFYSFLSKKLVSLSLSKLVFKPVAASSIMAIFIFLTSQRVNLFVIVTSSLLLYLSVLYLTRSFDDLDAKIWREAVSRVWVGAKG